MTTDRQLSSDNVSGACPEVMAALIEANVGHVPSYGTDGWTERGVDAIRRVFEGKCEVFLLATGTAANALALATICPPYGLVACHEAAHVARDECGAPGVFGHGLQLRLLK